MKSELPKFIYKYTKLNQRFYDMLVNRELWFAPPSSFNDPFDCQTPWDYEIVDEDVFEFLKSFDASLPITENKEELKAGVDRMTKTFLQQFTEIRENLGISCFSSVEDNLTMWAHYADSHKGVQICFDTSELGNIYTTIKEVIYSDDRPKINLFKNIEASFIPTVINKSKDWEKEREVRIFTDKPGYYPFEKEAVKKIRFGLRCTEKEIFTVKELLKNCGLNHVECSQAMLSKDIYKFANKA